MSFQLHATEKPCIFIFANAMNEKNHTVQLKASSQLFNKRIVSFMDVNATIEILVKTAFETQLS